MLTAQVFSESPVGSFAIPDPIPNWFQVSSKVKSSSIPRPQLTGRSIHWEAPRIRGVGSIQSSPAASIPAHGYGPEHPEVYLLGLDVAEKSIVASLSS